jgi:hypothetical protein
MWQMLSLWTQQSLSRSVAACLLHCVASPLREHTLEMQIVAPTCCNPSLEQRGPRTRARVQRTRHVTPGLALANPLLRRTCSNCTCPPQAIFYSLANTGTACCDQMLHHC